MEKSESAVSAILKITRRRKMNEHDSGSSDEEDIRKVVGSGQDRSENPIRRAWRLRQRMLTLGIEFEDDDERIRRTVGSAQHGRR